MNIVPANSTSILRIDERDIVFSRADLWRDYGPGSAEFEAYYRENPQFWKSDQRRQQMPDPERAGGEDNPMVQALFASIDPLGIELVVDGPPADHKTQLSPEQAQVKVKQLALLAGADLVGTGPLRQEWVYSHTGRTQHLQPGYVPRGTPIDLSRHTHAISLGFSMSLALVRAAPHFPTMLATAQAYAASAWTAVQVAQYLRRLGYSARAHHIRNYQVLSVPVAVDCGLGELSRAGYLLAPRFGLALRLATVTTDLPLAHDPPANLGIQSFCEQCQACAQACPVRAIPSGEKIEHNGTQRWLLDAEKCYTYWHTVGTDCGICMAVCPWSKPPTLFHTTVARLASIKGPHQGWLAAADQWFHPRRLK